MHASNKNGLTWSGYFTLGWGCKVPKSRERYLGRAPFPICPLSMPSPNYWSSYGGSNNHTDFGTLFFSAKNFFFI